MNIMQLKLLPIEEAIELINEDLVKVLQASKTTSSFGKDDEVEGLHIKCSWSTVTNHYGPLGYKLNRKNYQYEYVEELDTSKNAPEQQPKPVDMPFSEEEVAFLKHLYESSLQEDEKGAEEEKEVSQELRIRPRKGKKRATSISVYADTWNKWERFKEQYAYSATDLLDRALEEFMVKYNLEEEELEAAEEAVRETEE